MISSAGGRDEHQFDLQPPYRDKFRLQPVREILRNVLETKLDKAQYHPEHSVVLTKHVADEIKDRLKELNLPRYKIAVQVVISEQRGQGARVGCRTFWDASTDLMACETFKNDSLLCVAIASGVYHY
eukprot:GHVQ01027141.1.p1 GENE.GHVQ01027141.1~~GHVQ01027141.1.p1  ORF type:complete len:127 (+),score=16.88 GHVQ01027141.1:1193-1573(+)